MVGESGEETEHAATAAAAMLGGDCCGARGCTVGGQRAEAKSGTAPMSSAMGSVVSMKLTRTQGKQVVAGGWRRTAGDGRTPSLGSFGGAGRVPQNSMRALRGQHDDSAARPVPPYELCSTRASKIGIICNAVPVSGTSHICIGAYTGTYMNAWSSYTRIHVIRIMYMYIMYMYR